MKAPQNMSAHLPNDWSLASVSELANSPGACPFGRSHLSLATSTGALKSLKAGRRRLIRRADFERWIELGAPGVPASS